MPSNWGVRVREWTLDTSAELKGLRDSLHEALTGRPDADAALDDVPEKMVVVATELATNALKYGLPPTVVRLYRTDDHFILDVADHDTTVLPEYAECRPPGAGGLGLQIARRLALDIGWFVAEPTKHVWATFPRTATPSASGQAGQDCGRATI
jgi:hypothetical protein